MIDQEEQQQILKTIKTMCENDQLTPEERAERRKLLFLGVLIALPVTLPMHWQVAIRANQTAALMKEIV